MCFFIFSGEVVASATETTTCLIANPHVDKKNLVSSNDLTNTFLSTGDPDSAILQHDLQPTIETESNQQKVEKVLSISGSV